jgi:GT2 family glycosyltransferase
MNRNGSSDISVSVIIAASNSVSLLDDCLASLQSCKPGEDTETIVVSNHDNGVGELLRKKYPDAKGFVVSSDTTVPELRSRGIGLAKGEIIALTEDNCVVDSQWLTEIKRAHNLSYGIVGGAVENRGGNRRLDWAVYFYEYGKYMLPRQAGLTGSLPGNNVSYKRAVLRDVEGEIRAGLFEAFLHRTLEQRGHQLYFAPSAIVYHNRHYQFQQVLSQCYHHGRSYAGMRVAGQSLLRRMPFISGAAVLPVLLPVRIALGVLRKGRGVRELLFALPHLVVLMSSWAFGEFLGYLAGPGASARKWT